MNIRTTLLLLLAFAACFSMEAETITPSKKYVTRKVDADDFTSIRVNSFVDVEYTVGSRSVEIYAPDNIIDYIKVAVDGGELSIGYKEDMNINGKHQSCVKVSAPKVCNFTTASAGDISIKSPIRLKNDEVNFKTLSAGNIKSLSIEALSVKLTVNSAGDIKTGSIKADKVILSSNSAGDIETGEIIAKKEALLSSNSAGDIEASEVVAGEKVSVKANSAGDVEVSSINAPAAILAANSTGDVEVKSLTVTNVMARSNSLGKVVVSGNCDTADLASNSLGDINASCLKANHTIAKTGSTGCVTCQALQSLTATRHGKGTIKWTGNPSEVTIDDPDNNGVIKQ